MLLSQNKKDSIKRISVIFGAGVALFSDGYVNANGGATRYIIKAAYPDSYNAHYGTLFSSLVFVGVILGQVTFGFICDRVGRKPGMIFASIWLAVFSLLSALAYGGDNTDTLWKCLIAYRFLLGFGIGAEYPAGSVAAAENTEDAGVGKGHQQKLLVLATNTAIDWGFVIAYLVPYICLQIFGEGRLEWVWRLTLGFGMVVPLLVLPFRIAMREPKLYRDGAMQKIKMRDMPWGLTFKKYWPRLLGVCLSWFIYDWIAYPAGIYSSTIVAEILPDGTMSQNLGWDIVINALYLPGTIIGGLFVIDRLGPKYTMILGFMAQAIIGFAMSGAYDSLIKKPGGFLVLYGVYLSFGELGPGNCLGVLAAKATGPSATRGIFYSIAAAVGKLGAFIGTYVYTAIINDLGGDASKGGTVGPVYIGSGLCILASVVTFFLVPNIGPDWMTQEDERYREYLEQNGYDTSLLGVKPLLERESRAEAAPFEKSVDSDAKLAQE